MDRNARRLTLALLARRGGEATFCPSEVAWALALEAGEPTAWRRQMQAVHETVDQLQAEGRVRLSWKGQGLPARTGPYRIGPAGQ